MNNLVEIIIPVYNGEKTIAKTIDSIINQTHKNWRLFVINDGSTDNTREVLNKYGNHPQILILDQKNAGVSAARNKGLDLAFGQGYITCCDADDFWEPNHLEVSIQLLNKGYDLVYCNPNIIDTKGQPLFPTFSLYTEYKEENLRKGNFIYISSVVFRGKIGQFDSSLDPLADYDMWLQAAEKGYKFKQHDNKTCTYMVNPEGMAKDCDKYLDKLRDKHKNFLKLNHSGVSMKKKYSIIIGTLNHLEDCLKPCCEAIKKYTDLSNVEVIIVANGCTDGTREYVESLGEPFKLLWFDKPLGYSKANNEGLKIATGEYIVLLNNDAFLLEQPINQWLEMLEKPFKEDPTVGLTGPIKGHSDPAGRDFIIFFCCCISRQVLEDLVVYEEI